MPAKIERGCVLIARPILRSGLWTMPPADRVLAITAVVLANHGRAKWFDGASQVEIGRGQFVRSWGRLAREANLSVRKARVSAAHLAACGFLGRRPSGRYSLYSLPKYGFYQDPGRYGSDREIPGGYVLLARKVMCSSLWSLPPADRALAVTCLLLAHHSPEPADWSDGDRHLTVRRGGFATTWDRLASAANMGPADTRASMSRLESTEFVVRSEPDGWPPSFSVPNYDFYQSLSNYVEAPSSAAEGEPEAPKDGGTALEPGPGGMAGGGADGGGRTVTRGRQDSDKIVTRGRQDGDKRVTTNKNGKNGKNGEEGGVPPSPDLFPQETWGAEPPLPPGAEVARAYQERFPGVMGWPKALHQARLFLSRGGRAEDALRAIASEGRQRVVIWKILDPLTERGAGSCLPAWVPPEERGAAR